MTMLINKVLFYLWDATVKTTLLLAVVTVAAILSRRASASFRHLLWALGLGCALFLPVLSWNLPQWHVPVTVSPTRARPVAEAAPLAQAAPPASGAVVTKAVPVEQAASAPDVVSSASGPPPSVASPPTPIPSAAVRPSGLSRIPWPALILLTWITGAVLLLVQSVRGLAAIGEVAKSSVPIMQGPLADAARTAASSIQVGRRVELRQMTSVGEVTVPLTYGARRPVVVLPAEADRWPPERLRAVLLHEMAHVKRHDWALQMLSHLAGALYWFHPLVWVSTRRMRVESEAACDDLVLGAGVPAQDYARHLLDVALSVRDIRRLRSGAVAMAQGPKVEGRLRAVLALGLSRRPVARRAAAGVLAVCLLLVVPLAALRLVAQAEGVPVPAADHLQLQGDFTLRYSVIVTDLETTQEQLRVYQQVRADYQRELRKDPYFQPVPAEYYGPFSYFQSLRPKVRHLVLTVSSQDGKLLWRSEEGGKTFALVYNGRNGTQLFSNGQTGRIEPGFQFDEMTDCPLPAVGLPHVPLFKAGTATLASTSGTRQTWRALCPIEGATMEQGQVVYLFGVAHVVNDGGTWKALDLDTGTQQFEFLEHQRFQGLWLASQMRLVKYTMDPTPANVLPPHFDNLSDYDGWLNARRSATESCEYRLLSASETPLDLSAVGMRAVSAAPGSPVDRAAAQTQQLDGFDVQEALHLRYHLQGWAQSHETLLQQMVLGNPSARAAISRVYASLSGLPLPLWQGDPRPNHVWDGDPRTGHDGEKPLFTAERPSARDDGTVRDFEFSRSRDADARRGTPHVLLWASGRITRTAAEGSSRAQRQQEIVPAFFGEGGRSNMAGDGVEAVRSDSSPPSAPQLKPAVGFRRYTSPPLPDGTRYTFLYPSYFANVHQGWLNADHQFDSVRVDCIGTKPVPWIAFHGQTPVAYYIHGKQGASWLAPHEEFCSVVAGNAAAPFWQGPHPLEIDHQWVGEYGNHHDASINDAHTRYRFELIHEDRYTPALFKQTDSVIFKSFRVLPPGANATEPSAPAAQVADAVTPLPQTGGDTAAAHVALGERLQRQGQPRDGIPEFRRAVQIAPNDAEAQAHLAQALYQIKNNRIRTVLRYSTVGIPAPAAVMDEAIQHMEKAVALHPDNGEWHSLLGTYLSSRARYGGAIAQFRLALHMLLPVRPVNLMISSSSPLPQAAQYMFDAQWSLGDALLKTGQYQEAVVHYQEAIRLYPRADWVWLGYGDALNGSGRRAEARAAWRKCLAAMPSKSYYQRQARARLGRY